MTEDTFLSRVERMFGDMGKPPERGTGKMKRKLLRGASRPEGLSGADIEAAMQMGAEGRDIEAATQMGGERRMGRKLMRGAARPEGLSGADVEAALQMGAKGRDIEAATQMAADKDMGRKLMRGAARPEGLSGADMEAAMQMGAKGRDIEAAAQMAADKNRAQAENITEGLLRKPASEKGTGAMLVKKTGDKNFYDQAGIIPKAKLVAEDETVQSFFAKAHGGSFDPNSRVDKMKMQKILDMVNNDPKLLSLTPGKFAVKLYTTK